MELQLPTRAPSILARAASATGSQRLHGLRCLPASFCPSPCGLAFGNPLPLSPQDRWPHFRGIPPSGPSRPPATCPETPTLLIGPKTAIDVALREQLGLLSGTMQGCSCHRLPRREDHLREKPHPNDIARALRLLPMT